MVRNRGPDALFGADQRGTLSLAKIRPHHRGTTQIDHAASTIWAPVQKILTERLGLTGMTNPTDDLLNSSGIILLGSQLMETHPIVGSAARPLKKGPVFWSSMRCPGPSGARPNCCSVQSRERRPS